MNANFHQQEPLPEEATAALQDSGARLLAQLGAMRADIDNDTDSELEALDPQAELALRRSGYELLAQLEARRGSLANGSEQKAGAEITRRGWIWRRGAGIAAVLAGLLAAAQINTAPPEDLNKPADSVNHDKENPVANTVVPEPSSALLGILGGAFFLVRRRR